MADEPTLVHPALQFDRVVAASPPPAGGGATALACEACHAPVVTAYYHVNGKPFCRHCRSLVEAGAAAPPGIVPFVTALIFGFVAALAGAAIYYAVLAIAHLQIGLVAIATGYMVGYSVRKGAAGRGGLRF